MGFFPAARCAAVETKKPQEVPPLWFTGCSYTIPRRQGQLIPEGLPERTEAVPGRETGELEVALYGGEPRTRIVTLVTGHHAGLP